MIIGYRDDLSVLDMEIGEAEMLAKVGKTL